MSIILFFRLTMIWMHLNILVTYLVIITYSNPISVDQNKDIGLQRAITFTEPKKPLEFRKSARKKPKRKNLKTSRLLRKMGSDFRPDWMSIDEPVNAEETTVSPLLVFMNL